MQYEPEFHISGMDNVYNGKWELIGWWTLAIVPKKYKQKNGQEGRPNPHKIQGLLPGDCAAGGEELDDGGARPQEQQIGGPAPSRGRGVHRGALQEGQQPRHTQRLQPPGLGAKSERERERARERELGDWELPTEKAFRLQ